MADPAHQGTLRVARILHFSFLLAIVVYAALLLVMESNGTTPAVLAGDPALTYAIGGLSMVAASAVAIGLFIGRWAAERVRRPGAEVNVLAVHIGRCASFEAVAICGLVLRILGAGWVVSAPFFAVSLALMLITLPNEERWSRLAGKG